MLDSHFETYLCPLIKLRIAKTHDKRRCTQVASLSVTDENIT